MMPHLNVNSCMAASMESNKLKRYTLFPIQHEDVWKMYKQAISAFWTVEELDFTRDVTDWTKLNDNERYFISMILAFFAGSDGIVAENITTNFLNDIDIPEVQAFYAFQNAIEMIHSETYSLMIDTFIHDSCEKSKMFDAMNNFDCVKEKAQWALKWMNSEKSFSERLVAFACVEGIFFSGSFCSIFWLKKRGLMHGLCLSNEFISRDESLHTEFAILMYNKFAKKLDKAVLLSIITEAVDIEKNFITSALPCKLIGMNSELMSEYIEFVADRLLVQLGSSKCYYKSNPFPWMELISMEGKTNFFERKVSEYSKAGIQVHATQPSSKTFCSTANF